MSANVSSGLRGWSRLAFNKRNAWWGLLFLALWSLLVAGCGGDDTDTNTNPNGTTDSGSDAKQDAPKVDSGKADADSGPVVAPDAEGGVVAPDADSGPIGVDATDAPVDAPKEVGPDAPGDAPVDAPKEVGPDAPVVDAPADVVPDRLPDVTPPVDAPNTSDVVEAGPVTLVSIAVTPTAPSIAKGTTRQFTATGTYSDNSHADISNSVTWASSNTGVATINGTGLATSPNNGSTGTTNITATSGAVVGSTVLTVTQAVLQSIAVTPSMPSIVDGTSIQLTATGTFSDQTTQDLTGAVTWSSSATGVATVNAAGLASSQSTGTATITATQGTVSGSTVLTVTTATLVSITVNPPNATIHTGTVQGYTATGHYTNGTTQDLTSTVTWDTSNHAIATIDANGIATGVAAGDANVTATSGITGSTVLHVVSSALSSISISPSHPTIPNGRTQQFTATGHFADSTTQDLTQTATWGATNGTGSCSISNASGTRGVATATGVGDCAITAQQGGQTGNATLTISMAVLQSITIDPPSASIAKGTHQQFTATGIFSDSSTQDLTATVTWATSNNAIATVSNAGGSQGLALAAGLGGVSITATDPGTGITGAGNLAVTAATLQSVTVNPSNPTIPKGTQIQFSAIGTYTDNTTQDLTIGSAWDSSATAIATVSSSSGTDGLATGIATGQATITATYQGVAGTTILHVSPATLVSITITPVNPSIALGSTQQFAATGTFSDSSTSDLTTSVTWGSSQPGVSTISPTGLASSHMQGQTLITATMSGVNTNTVLTVTAAVLQSIAVTPTNPSIAKGTKVQFTATGTYTDSSTQDLTNQVAWTSSDGTIASVTTNGQRGNATGLNVGDAAITATSGAISGNTTLHVTSAQLVSISVTPVNPSIALGTSQQFTATGTYTDGTVQDLTSTATWSSGTPATATINPSTGLAQSVAIGSTLITATSGTVSSTSTLTVTPATLSSITVTPATPTIANGTSQQFLATGHYSDNSTQDLTLQATWSSGTPSVAVVVPSGPARGFATAIAAGTSTITATFQGVPGSTLLTVTTATLDSITISPVAVTIANGTTKQFTATGHYSDGTSQDITAQVTWDTSDHARATISNAAGSAGLATSVSPGPTVVVTATLNSVNAMASLTVSNATLSSITVLPSNRSVTNGAKVQYSATGTFSDNSTQDLSTQVAWSSTDITVAIISNTTPKGEATAVGPGTATIRATLNTTVGSTSLTVGN